MSFSDTLIQIDQDRKLYTTLYRKPTNLYSYHHNYSCHPHHQKNRTLQSITEVQMHNVLTVLILRQTLKTSYIVSTTEATL